MVKSKTIRLPKGVSWIRFEGDLCSYLLYYGLQWGYVYKPTPGKKTKVRTSYVWNELQDLSELIT